MCFKKKAVRGATTMRFKRRESATCQSAERDEKEVARRHEISKRKAAKPEAVAKRARRSAAKRERIGMQGLRKRGLAPVLQELSL